MYDEHLNDWLDVAKSRERLPESVETMFAAKLRVSSKFVGFYLTLFRNNRHCFENYSK